MIASQKLKIMVLGLVMGLLPLEAADAADLSLRSHYFKKHRRIASLEYVSDAYSPCRIGWWQTLRAGHVRPLWSVRCR